MNDWNKGDAAWWGATPVFVRAVTHRTPDSDAVQVEDAFTERRVWVSAERLLPRRLPSEQPHCIGGHHFYMDGDYWQCRHCSQRRARKADLR